MNNSFSSAEVHNTVTTVLEGLSLDLRKRTEKWHQNGTYEITFHVPDEGLLVTSIQRLPCRRWRVIALDDTSYEGSSLVRCFMRLLEEVSTSLENQEKELEEEYSNVIR